MTVQCFRCGTAIPENNLGRQDTCAKCGADTRCCRNCLHYDRSRNNECREEQAGRQVDKEKGNFCEWFQVRSGGSGHREALQVIFYPSKESYSTLVEEFLRQTDPFDDSGQFCDKGEQFRSAVYYESEAQKAAAIKVIRKMESKLGKGGFLTAVLPAGSFYPAEARLQGYYASSPVQFKLYSFGCGRDERLEAVWGASTR